ncbi:MAG: hypothetical protein A2754_04050 [Candidatus Magasanikbacteria bacterium RIFCSPHIGHO2_01_FULL_47_8]|uniref:Uncharacterized protein n=1 Tax=Candidatus Magasanikbacteria bacterium RIFCSPHIGHO2_01_FULL_47_8 TaxID=1798673 RepID=A0A1F6MD30_9BACT|nr:MAG: hypothetical protein A2754_04050 [Candidatus Magasanikbacteria bacterium RIFCSPHIGHO2_01_FULL_47_8]
MGKKTTLALPPKQVSSELVSENEARLRVEKAIIENDVTEPGSHLVYHVFPHHTDKDQIHIFRLVRNNGTEEVLFRIYYSPLIP